MRGLVCTVSVKCLFGDPKQVLEPLDLELQAAADVDAGNLSLIPEGQQVLLAARVFSLAPALSFVKGY